MAILSELLAPSCIGQHVARISATGNHRKGYVFGARALNKVDAGPFDDIPNRFVEAIAVSPPGRKAIG